MAITMQVDLRLLMLLGWTMNIYMILYYILHFYAASPSGREFVEPQK
jgi:hypothetical protein